MKDLGRAYEVHLRGGPDGPTGLLLAAHLPSVEEIADTILSRGLEDNEADALEAASELREGFLETLARLLAGEADENENEEGP